jgi:hypothetical protein
MVQPGMGPMNSKHRMTKQVMRMMTIDEFQIGGDMSVRRLGFGAMRLTGKGVWGGVPLISVQ